MKFEFLKMQSAGNDYVYADCRAYSLVEPDSVAKKVSARHFSVGADGLVIIENSIVADYKMRIFNADGTEAKVCGNALRCSAYYYFSANEFSKRYACVETECGVKKAYCSDEKDDKIISAEMGKVVFRQDGVIDVGNLHKVIFTEDVKNYDFKKIENFEPDKFNYEAVKVVGKNKIIARVFERGSGETFSCGSGACAVAAAAVKENRASCGDIEVAFPGGELIVTVKEDYFATLTGKVEPVFYGAMEI